MFVARRLVEGMWAGRHASVRQGRGLEFHDYRAYAPGDDPGDVDWKLYGRTNRFYLRRYQQLTDLNVHLLIDCSASMNFAGLDRHGKAITGNDQLTKLRYASALAAAISFLTIRQTDRVGVGVYADRIIEHMPSVGTWAHLKRICNTLESTEPAYRQGDVGAAMRQAHAILRQRGTRARGLLVVISDLLDEPGPWFDGINLFRHDRFDVIVFQVLTSQELDLSGIGASRLRLVDAETRHQVGTDIGRTRNRYTQIMGQHITALRRGCTAANVDYNLLTTDQPVTTALRRYLVRRSAARS